MRLLGASKTQRILFGLMVLAIVLDTLFFTGFYASDDVQYLTGARAIGGAGTFVPDIGNVRLGITFPSAIVLWITGSVDAVVWFHALYHPLLVLLAFLLGRVLHGERVGLIASAFVATSPLLYRYAGAILPDNATACWLTASTILLCELRRGPGNAPPLSRHRVVGYLASGVMLGIAYTCKETTLIMTLPAAVFTITAGPVRKLGWIRDGAVLALGLALVMLAEYLVLRAMSGEWISRLSFVTNNTDDFRWYMDRQGTFPHERLLYAADKLGVNMPVTLWMFVAAAVAYVVVRGRDLALAFAFWWPLLYMTIGSTQLSEYIPPAIQDRYYAIVIVPAAIMLAKLVVDLLDRRPRRSMRLFALVVVVTVVVYELWKGLPYAGSNYRSDEVRAFRTAVDIAQRRYSEYPVVIGKYYQWRMPPLLEGTYFPPPPPGVPYVVVETLIDAEPQIAQPPPDFAIQQLEVVPPPLTAGMLLVNRAIGIERRRILRKHRRPASAALILVTPRTP